MVPARDAVGIAADAVLAAARVQNDGRLARAGTTLRDLYEALLAHTRTLEDREESVA
jgi:hypothetical protein